MKRKELWPRELNSLRPLSLPLKTLDEYQARKEEEFASLGQPDEFQDLAEKKRGSNRTTPESQRLCIAGVAEAEGRRSRKGRDKKKSREETR